MNKIEPLKIKNILIVRIGKLGDMIATSFVFEVIRRNNPSANISLITSSGNKNILKDNPTIDKIHFVDSGIRKYLQLLLLSLIKYDLIIDFNDNPSSTTKLIFSLFRGKVKAGYAFPLYESVINLSVPQLEKDNSHIIERMSHFLSSIGFNCDEEIIKPYLYIGAGEEKEITNLLQKYPGRKIISINLSAGAEIRFWDAKNWIELIKKIHILDNNYIFVLLYVRENRLAAREIMSKLEGLEMISPEPASFQHFAAWIKYSHILVTPDTSAVHVAGAFKVPVLALYPNSDWNFASWRPYATRFRAIHSAAESVNAISIDEVFNNFVELNKEILENA